MKTRTKRLFTLLLALVLLLSALNWADFRAWAEETDGEPGGDTVFWTDVPGNGEDPSETGEPTEVLPGEDPTDPAEPTDGADPTEDPDAADETETPDDDPVAEVAALLAQIDSLEQMQYYRVTVTKGEKNALSAEVLYDGAPALTVVNPYVELLTQAEFKVTKRLTGRSWKDDDSFTFLLVAVTEGAPMPPASQVTATKDKQIVSFGTAVFTEPGTYEYKIQEVAGKAANVAYDTAAHKVIVTVTLDEETQKLQAVVTYDNASSLTVTNKYTTPPPGPPTTGDFSQPGLWAGLAAASLLGLCALLLAYRKLRRS